MKYYLSYKNLTPVAFILYAVLVLTGLNTNAADPAPVTPSPAIVVDPRITMQIEGYKSACEAEMKKNPNLYPSVQACAAAKMNSDENSKELGKTCKIEERAQRENYEKLVKACGGAGWGGSLETCYSKVDECLEKTSSEDFSDIESMAGAVGVPLNLDPVNGLERQCPSLSGKDHQERAKEVKSDLNSAQKDLIDAKKDIAKGEKDAKQNMIDIQKRIAELEKNIKENRLKLSRDQQQRMMDMTRTLNDKKEQISKEEGAIITLLAKKNAAINKKRTDLIGVADDLISTQCQMQTQDKMKDFGGSASKGSTNALTSRGGAKKALQTRMVDTCIAQALSKRKEIVDSANAEIDSIDKQIHDAEDRLEAARTELAQLDLTSRQETMNAEKEKSDLETDYKNNAYLLQQELMAAQTDFQKQSQASQSAMLMAQQKIMMSSNDMLRVGNGPKANVKVSTDEVDSAWKTYGAPLSDWGRSECCKTGKFSYCNVPYMKGSSDGEGGSRGSRSEAN